LRGYTKSAGGSRFYIIRKQRGFILYYKIKKIGDVDFVKSYLPLFIIFRFQLLIIQRYNIKS